MGEQNRKKANKKAEKEKKKELAKKKKALEEELDELKGNTVQGKAVCAFVFLLLLGLSMGLFVGMVKLDVGGFAGNVLAPLIGDVPVARSILPAEMQRKSPSELAAEQAQADLAEQVQAVDTAAQAQAVDTAAQTKAENASAQAADAQAQANVTAQADAATHAADTQAQADTAAQTADAQATAAQTADAQATAAQAADAQATAAQAADVQAQTDAAAQAADAQAQAEAEAAKALQDYVDTYSAMNPQDAAQLFESMIPAQEDVVISILENLTPEGRAAILSNMSTANAADLTIQMQRKMEARTQY